MKQLMIAKVKSGECVSIRLNDSKELRLVSCLDGCCLVVSQWIDNVKKGETRTEFKQIQSILDELIPDKKVYDGLDCAGACLDCTRYCKLRC